MTMSIMLDRLPMEVVTSSYSDRMRVRSTPIPFGDGASIERAGQPILSTAPTAGAESFFRETKRRDPWLQIS